MKTYLYSIDNGNTNPHIAKWLNSKLLEILPLREFDFTKVLCDDQFIISNVSKSLKLPKQLNIIKIPEFKKDYFLDMPVHYEASIGVDRLYQAFFLYHQMKLNNKILLIDSGTFTTIDYIEQDGLHGGYIFPGPQTFLASYGKGENLPIIDQKNEHSLKRALPHKTTEAILHSTNLYHYEVLKSIISTQLPSEIYLTGGHSDYIEKILNEMGEDFNLCINKQLIHHALYFIAKKLQSLNE